jgi:hypothetical protein
MHAWRLVSSLLVHARVSRVFSWRTSVCLCSRPVVGLDGCRGGLGGRKLRRRHWLRNGKRNWSSAELVARGASSSGSCVRARGHRHG